MAQAYRREKLIKIMNHLDFEKRYCLEKYSQYGGDSLEVGDNLAHTDKLSPDQKFMLTYYSGQADMLDRIMGYMQKELDL